MTNNDRIDGLVNRTQLDGMRRRYQAILDDLTDEGFAPHEVFKYAKDVLMAMTNQTEKGIERKERGQATRLENLRVRDKWRVV